MTKTEAKRIKLTKTLEEAHAIADRALALARGSRIPKPQAPGATKEERKADRNARWAVVRATVMERAGEACEWCTASGMTLEAHHLVGGGSRRAEETEIPELVAAVCWDCHRAWERNSMSAFLPAMNWAMRHNFEKAKRVIQKRIDHVESSPTLTQRSDP